MLNGGRSRRTSPPVRPTLGQMSATERSVLRSSSARSSRRVRYWCGVSPKDPEPRLKCAVEGRRARARPARRAGRDSGVDQVLARRMAAGDGDIGPILLRQTSRKYKRLSVGRACAGRPNAGASSSSPEYLALFEAATGAEHDASSGESATRTGSPVSELSSRSSPRNRAPPPGKRMLSRCYWRRRARAAPDSMSTRRRSSRLKASLPARRSIDVPSKQSGDAVASGDLCLECFRQRPRGAACDLRRLGVTSRRRCGKRGVRIDVPNESTAEPVPRRGSTPRPRCRRARDARHFGSCRRRCLTSSSSVPRLQVPPMAAAIGSSISETRRAPAASVASSTAFRRTSVVLLGTQRTTCE